GAEVAIGHGDRHALAPEERLQAAAESPGAGPRATGGAGEEEQRKGKQCQDRSHGEQILSRMGAPRRAGIAVPDLPRPQEGGKRRSRKPYQRNNRSKRLSEAAPAAL